MQETRQNRISRLLQKELSLIFQSQTRMMHGAMGIYFAKIVMKNDKNKAFTNFFLTFPSKLLNFRK